MGRERAQATAAVLASSLLQDLDRQQLEFMTSDVSWLVTPLPFLGVEQVNTRTSNKSRGSFCFLFLRLTVLWRTGAARERLAPRRGEEQGRGRVAAEKPGGGSGG